MNKKRKIAVFFTVLIMIFAFFIFYIKFLVTPLMVDTSTYQIKLYATKSMNYAVTETMNQNISYDDLINIITDSSGKIGMIQANTVKINNVSMMIERITLTHLLEISRNPIKIPLGAFTGISIFSGMGPPVLIDIYPYGDVTCKFLSQFISAGINQTQHKIYVSIDAKVNVVLPFKTISVEMSNDVLVCESVIIGEIPETYLKSNTLTEMLNLVP
ncbi:MAG: sporulation protein YunB [Clostridia bacterium]|nr:sporulation protein YunB [Clostridia bacterium]